MLRHERLAIATVFLIVIGLPAAALGYQYRLRSELTTGRVVDIAMTIPEDGGFQTDFIKVSAGEPITLRFSSHDVTHGVAIGPGLDIDLGHIDPGKVKTVTLTFDEPGIYTYYCNAWCSPNHWRMRGTIQVTDPAHPDTLPAAPPDPVIQALVAEGVDIDASHAEHEVDSPLVQRPSAARGAQLIDTLNIPTELTDQDWRRSHTPMAALDSLVSANPSATQTDLVDVVAFLWQAPPSPDAQTLYNKNCAACHGQYGAADGPAADQTTENPVVFADPAYMWEMRSDILYAKIRRGGMGTDMPNFGTLLTQDETWALVNYLWTFLFEGSAD